MTEPAVLQYLEQGETRHWVACDMMAKGETYEVFIAEELFSKRCELFRVGHRLVVLADTDGQSPVLYAFDAWFDQE